MSTATVIEIRRYEAEGAGASIPVHDGGDRKSQYDRLLALVLRLGNWLSSPQARLQRPEDWDVQFHHYQEQLEQLRRLGDELRPVSLRDRGELLAGDALVGEVLELFAA